MESNKVKVYIPWILISILAAVIVYLFFFREVPVDNTQQYYLMTKELLEASAKDKSELIDKLQEVRDSAFVAIKNNVVTETIVIEQKHEKIRNNIRLLPRSKRVQLFADRYKSR